MVRLPCWTYELCSSKHHRLKSVQLIACDTHGTAPRTRPVIAQPAGRHNGKYGESVAAKQCSGNKWFHRCIAVDVDAQVTHWQWWYDQAVADCHYSLWYLFLSLTRRAPDDVGVCHVKLSLIQSHLHCHLVDARSETSVVAAVQCLLDDRCRRSACHQYTDVGRDDVTLEVIVDLPCTEEIGSWTDSCSTPHRMSVGNNADLVQKTHWVQSYNVISFY